MQVAVPNVFEKHWKWQINSIWSVIFKQICIVKATQTVDHIMITYYSCATNGNFVVNLIILILILSSFEFFNFFYMNYKMYRVLKGNDHEIEIAIFHEIKISCKIDHEIEIGIIQGIEEALRGHYFRLFSLT